MRTGARLRLPGAALALAVCGCSLVLPRQPVPPEDEGPWPRERDQFTRTQKIYDKLDDKAFATATYQSLGVRIARIARLAVWRGLTDEERDALLAKERDDAAQYEDFLVAFFVADLRSNDLDSRRSVWRVALHVAGEGEILPSRVESVTKDATLEALYPYIGHFDVVYRLRFPRWKGPKPLAEVPFSLILAGAIGRVELGWNEPPAGPATAAQPPAAAPPAPGPPPAAAPPVPPSGEAPAAPRG